MIHNVHNKFQIPVTPPNRLINCWSFGVLVRSIVGLLQFIGSTRNRLYSNCHVFHYLHRFRMKNAEALGTYLGVAPKILNASTPRRKVPSKAPSSATYLWVPARESNDLTQNTRPLRRSHAAPSLSILQDSP